MKCENTSHFTEHI